MNSASSGAFNCIVSFGYCIARMDERGPIVLRMDILSFRPYIEHIG